jgi:type I restriction enzyme, S subunit
MNPELLIAHFDPLSNAPDAIPRLRRFVLDLAVRGKLVEQDAKDEPISKLINSIETQNSRRGIAGGATKVDIEPIANDDVPFEIPSAWMWARLGAICSKTGSGSTPRGGKSVYQRNGVPFLRSQNVHDDGVRLDDVAYIAPQTHEKMSGTAVKPGDLLLNITGGSIGRCCLVPNDLGPANVSQHVAIVRAAVDGIQRYLHQLILSPYFQSLILSEQTGAGRGGLPKNRMDRIPVALPPLAEQHRIVAKVDELMALCDRLETVQLERDSRRDRLTAAFHHHLNNGADADTLRKHAQFFIGHLPRLTARPDQIKQLRETILNLAVRGKLVPQDPKAEPAFKLLNRIQAEKARLVKAGEIRAQVAQAAIQPDETPFALPKGWVWTRLGEVIHLVSGQHLQPSEYSDREGSGPPYITGPADFGVNGLAITRYALVRKAVAQKGQILLTVKGAGVGKTAICDLAEVAISRQLMAMTAIGWSQQFLLLVTHRLAETLKESARSLIPGISREDVDRFIFSLPPLTEQHRIVAKVDELMALCDKLEAQLTSAQTDTSRLLEAVLHKALNDSNPHALPHAPRRVSTTHSEPSAILISESR